MIKISFSPNEYSSTANVTTEKRETYPMSSTRDPHWAAPPTSGPSGRRSSIPEDPSAFVARAQEATNSCDTEWPMTIYASNIRLETIGDGVRDVHDGADAVRPALETLYKWLARIDATVDKSLTATSPDTIVNTFEGRLFGGRQITHGVELWHFDQTGKVVHNLLYTCLNPKSQNNPVSAMRMLLGHPRPTWSYLKLKMGRHH